MLLAGEVGRPHGVSGEVYVVRISDDPTRFDPGQTLVHEDGRVLVIESSRGHHDRLLVRFEGVTDRPAAEALRGPLYVAADEVRSLDPGEYWQGDLIGCVVVDQSGAPIGEVEEVIAAPAQDLLRVTTDSGPKLIPLVAAIVREVDISTKRVVVDAPPGLLD